MRFNAISSWFKVVLCILLSAGILLGLSRLNPMVFPDIGEPTAFYDCDDETLDMYRHFTALGVEAIPVVGNLELTGEQFTNCDHIWLMVRSGEKHIAYDWGLPRFDAQHYEGFKISPDYLLYAVDQDKKNVDLSDIANKNP
jgi:hypothetical protein